MLLNIDKVIIIFIVGKCVYLQFYILLVLNVLYHILFIFLPFLLLQLSSFGEVVGLEPVIVVGPVILHQLVLHNHLLIHLPVRGLGVAVVAAQPLAPAGAHAAVLGLDQRPVGAV